MTTGKMISIFQGNFRGKIFIQIREVRNKRWKQEVTFNLFGWSKKQLSFESNSSANKYSK
jgi:hypothetical protein